METQTIRYSFTRNFNNSCSDCSVFCDDQEKNDNNETCKKIVIWSPTGPKSTGTDDKYTYHNGDIVGISTGNGFRIDNVNLGFLGRNDGLVWYLMNTEQRIRIGKFLKAKITNFKKFRDLYDALLLRSVPKGSLVYIDSEECGPLLFADISSEYKYNATCLLGCRVKDSGMVNTRDVSIPKACVKTYTLFEGVY